MHQSPFWLLLSLAAAMILDYCIGDPQWRWHPVRGIGALADRAAGALRRLRLDGLFGGLLLAAIVVAASTGAAYALLAFGSAPSKRVRNGCLR